MIDLHNVRTANGLKIGIMLEEVELPYRVINYDIFAGDHLTPRFKKINPNHKLPVIVDHDAEDKGGPFAVFESAAILIYLAEKSGKLLPTEFRARSICLQWLSWQVSGLGPMLGQAYHFVRYAPEGQEYGIQRYTREAHRLLSVLNHRLSEDVYLAKEFSIADIACWVWVQNIASLGMRLTEFPAINRWSDMVKAKPSVIKVTQSSDMEVPSSYLEQRMQLTPSQWSNMFGDNLLRAVSRG